MILGYKTWKECGNEIIRFYGKHYLSIEYKNMLNGLLNECESNKYYNYEYIPISKQEGKMILKLLRKLIFHELNKKIYLDKNDYSILFNLKCYLENLLINGQDKIFYNDLLFEEKTIDCINAIVDVLKEVKKNEKL